VLITVHTYPPALDVNQTWLGMLAGTQIIQPTSLSQPYIPKLDVFEGGCAEKMLLRHGGGFRVGCYPSGALRAYIGLTCCVIPQVSASR
jgi:hypothetical protein